MDVKASLKLLTDAGFDTKRFEFFWTQPQRKYHALNPHMVDMLGFAHQATEFYDLDDINTIRLHLDCWYHDIVYVVGMPDNEMQSGLLALEEIEGPLGQAVLEDVLATKDHRRAPSFIGAILIDCDLAGLGTNNYERNGELVRQEYGLAADDPKWIQGRLKFLHAYLSRKFIFHTSWGQQYEAVARVNMDKDWRDLWAANGHKPEFVRKGYARTSEPNKVRQFTGISCECGGSFDYEKHGREAYRDHLDREFARLP